VSDTTRLVDDACGGNREALETLYSRHAGRLVAFIRSRMSDQLAQRISAEDILQETLLESSRKIDAFVSQGGASFYRWLVGIARNKVLEANRARLARKRSIEGPLEIDLAQSQTSPSGRAIRIESAVHLHHALAALPDRQAEAVRCRYLEGLSLAETAERLQCSEPAVKALVSRGLLDLSQRMAAPE
jgi:RNA polymerase sigma-70 factor (ECF subfamily)